ncbi:MAG: pyruvate, phosphate dikinase, partial [Planctomycetes bacterium]|nr:pyruvate, phosphate dikinase [Planctomycetota bacterium]
GTRNPETGEMLERELPEVFAKLSEIRVRLEDHFRDMQDLEFTVEDGDLYLLQTRSGKRSALAALRIAVDLVREGKISRREALERLREVDPARLRGKRIAAADGSEPLAAAVPASAGVAAGRIALTSEGAVALHESGAPVVLVREETSADDIAGMAVSRGILTARGGRTSHAAVVARHMGISCLVGCRELRIDLGRKAIELGGRVIGEGEWLTLDGNAGQIHAGELAVEEEPEPPELAEVRAWARAEAWKDHPLA